MSQVESSPIPSSDCESPARRVLAIPELLQVIFNFGTRTSNASNALVCRSWSGPALDHVWREVDNLYHLLRLLVPLRRKNRQYVRRLIITLAVLSCSLLRGSFQEFDHSPTPEDWAHFIPHARRV